MRELALGQLGGVNGGTHKHTDNRTHVHTLMHTQTHIHTDKPSCKLAHAHIYIYIHTHTNTHTHTHTHTHLRRNQAVSAPVKRQPVAASPVHDNATAHVGPLMMVSS